MDAFFMRRVAFRRDASTYIRGRIVTDRNATHEKRIRVGQALVNSCMIYKNADTKWTLNPVK